MSGRVGEGAQRPDRFDLHEAQHASGTQSASSSAPAAGQAAETGQAAGTGTGEAAPRSVQSRMLRDDAALDAVMCGSRELGKGERGDHVRKLQDALASLSGRQTPGGGADGTFGVGTEREVMAFQRKNGLTPTGRVDQATLAAIDAKLVDAQGTRTSALPAPVPLRGTPQSYLRNATERQAYESIERKLWTGASWSRGLDAAVTDADTLAVLDKLETLPPASYNRVLHAMAATRVEGEPFAPTLLDKFITRGTSQPFNATLSSRFCDQMTRKLEGHSGQPDNRILRHVSPDSVDQLKGWAGWGRLIQLFA